MGATLGCRALTLKKIIILAAIFELLGSILLGGFVAQTLSSGLLKFPTENITELQMREFMLAMVSVLVGSGVWLCIATLLSLPVSTTHSVVGSLIGCGVYMSGWNSVDWTMILKITSGWVLSPVIGGIVAAACWYPLRRFTLRSALPTVRIFQFLPALAGLTIGILAMFILYKGLSPLKVEVPIYIALPCALALGAITGVIIWKLVIPIIKKAIDKEIQQPVQEEQEQEVELENVVNENTEEQFGNEPQHVVDQESTEDPEKKFRWVIDSRQI